MKAVNLLFIFRFTGTLLILMAVFAFTSVTQATMAGRFGGGYVGGRNGGVAQMHLPHQLINVLDLITPLHIRVATDGIKHKPIVRFPILELAAHGHLHRPGIVHLVHGPGIPW